MVYSRLLSSQDLCIRGFDQSGPWTTRLTAGKDCSFRLAKLLWNEHLIGKGLGTVGSLCLLTLDLKPAPQPPERMGQQHYQREILFIPKQEKHTPASRELSFCVHRGLEDKRDFKLKVRGVASVKVACSKWTESGGVMMSWRDSRWGDVEGGLLKKLQS